MGNCYLKWLLGLLSVYLASAAVGAEVDPRVFIQARLETLQAVTIDYKDVYSEPAATQPSTKAANIARPLSGPRIVSKRSGQTVLVRFTFLAGSALWDTKLSDYDIRASRAENISANEERIWVSNQKSSEEFVKRAGGRAVLGDIRAGAQLPPASAIELGLGLRKSEFEGWLPPKDVSAMPYSKDSKGRVILRSKNEKGQEIEYDFDPAAAFALVEYHRMAKGVVVADIVSSDFKSVEGRYVPFAVVFIRRSLKGIESSRHTVSVLKYSFDRGNEESAQLHIEFPKMNVTDLRTGDTFKVTADKTTLTDEVLAQATAMGTSPPPGENKPSVVLMPRKEVTAALLRRPSTEAGRRGRLLAMTLAAAAILIVCIAVWKRGGRRAA